MFAIDNICLAGEVVVEGKEVRSTFYGARKPVEAQAKTIGLGLKEGLAVEVAAIVFVISKTVVVCAHLLEYMFAPLFGAVVQTVIDRFASSFGSLILSFNGDISGIKLLCSNTRISLISKGLFGVYFRMVWQVSRQTKDNNDPGRPVAIVAAITTIIGYFWCALSVTVVYVAVTAIVTMGIGFDNCLIIIHDVSCPHCGERIITMNGEYFNVFNGLKLAAGVLSPNAIEIEDINGQFQQQQKDDIDGALTDVFDTANTMISQINVNEIMRNENEKKNNKTIFDIVKIMVKIKEYI